MGYDRGDSFPSDFEPNGIPFGENGTLPEEMVHGEMKNNK